MAIGGVYSFSELALEKNCTKQVELYKVGINWLKKSTAQPNIKTEHETSFHENSRICDRIITNEADPIPPQ